MVIDFDNNRQIVCDFLLVINSRPNRRRGPGQATYICVPLSPSSIFGNGQGARVISLAGKVAAGLVQSDGSLYTTGFMAKSPAGRLRRNRDQLRAKRP